LISFPFSVAGSSDEDRYGPPPELLHPALWRRYWPSAANQFFYSPSSLLRLRKDDFAFPEMLRGSGTSLAVPWVELLAVLLFLLL
jgi:hypothetical protein